MENTIVSFINQQMKWAREYPEQADLYEHNAYGALVWEIQRTNDQDLMDMWEDRFYPAFEKIKRGF